MAHHSRIEAAPEAPARLTPTMASFRLLVFAFVRDYIGLMGHSPSYGEIANKLNSNRQRVVKAVRSLERDGLLLRSAGPRGLQLPSMRDEAIRQLRAMGWVVDEDVGHAGPPAAVPVTKRQLLAAPALDYRDGRTTGGVIDGGQGGKGTRKGGGQAA
jgi:biotin operon repressor